MRSLLFENQHRSQGKTQGILFFGCRSAEKDYYYKDDWQSKLRSNTIVFPAFSRDQAEKVYVQHKMIEYGKELWQLIHENGAYIYLSGNAKRMPIDVSEALVEIFKKHGGLEQENATAYLQYLGRVGRFQEECWS